MSSITDDDMRQKNVTNPQLQSVLSSILEKCKYESDNNTLTVPLEAYEQRVSYYTGLSKLQVSEIMAKLNNKPDYFDMSVVIKIMKCMKEFYTCRMSPTLEDVYESVKLVTDNIPEGVAFKQYLSSLGYEYKKTVNGSILMQDPSIPFERYQYLRKITDFKSKHKNIYYLDERLVYNDLNFQKVWSNNSAPPNAYVFLHAVCERGLVNGIFCCPLTEEGVKKWITDILLPGLKPKSLIVLDNNPLYGTKQVKKITPYHTKSDMLNWLKNNNIPCSDNMCKAQLYKLIERYYVKNENLASLYNLDSILIAYGFQVLRVPLSLTSLTPTELLWQHVRRLLKPKLETRPEIISYELKDIVYKTITCISDRKWIEFNTNVLSMESEILKLDTEIETLIDSNYELDVNDLPIDGSFY